MRIAKLTICGFRNFASQEITFGDKTLLFGANDSGKSNLLYALRILFDPSFNSRHFELNESDFNVETNASSVEITAELTDVHEPCLLSAFRGDLKDGKVGLFGGFCGRDSGIGPAQRAKTTIWN